MVKTSCSPWGGTGSTPCLGLIPGQELRFHMLWGVTKKKKKKGNSKEAMDMSF